MKRSLIVLIVLGLAATANAATYGPSKIGGAGPIDRPTALESMWCFQEWDCGLFDTFTADGTTATVVITARNWDSYGSNPPMNMKLDNFFVVEAAEHDAHMLAIGGLSGSYNCASGPADEMLDIASLDPAKVAYSTQFAGSIGPEWSGPAGQLLYQPPTTPSDSADENPFSPGPKTTGSMRLGAGTGPEFNSFELQLAGLTPGQDYVISYWWRSPAEDNFPQNCSGENDDLEIEIFGETLVCTPDLPEIVIDQVRTLAWDHATGIWRFQLRISNVGNGPATGLGITLEDASGGVNILEGFSEFGDLPPTGGTGVYTGSFEVDISGKIEPGNWFYFLFEYDDDCSQSKSDGIEFMGSDDPARYPTAAPASRPFKLSQNEPNPFNPRTRIEFELSQPDEIELQIFDLRGRQIRQLAAGSYPAGPHELIWNGRDDAGRIVAGGTYYYRLQTSSDEQVRKMVLLK